MAEFKEKPTSDAEFSDGEFDELLMNEDSFSDIDNITSNIFSTVNQTKNASDSEEVHPESHG